MEDLMKQISHKNYSSKVSLEEKQQDEEKVSSIKTNYSNYDIKCIFCIKK